MGKLYLMTTIVDRKIVKKYLELYKENGQNVMFFTLGVGTATNEMLDYFGLDVNEKALGCMVVDEETWFSLKKLLFIKKQQVKKLLLNLTIILTGCSAMHILIM